MKANKLLLIPVVFVLVILIVIFLLKPSETSKKTRDEQRIADLEKIKKALDFYLSKNAKAGQNLETLLCTNCGTNFAVYSYREISVADTKTIAKKGQFVNGNGWVPVDFSQNMKIKETPLQLLPIDPFDESSEIWQKFPFLKSFYAERDSFGYTFTPGKDGKYKLTAKMESSQGLEKAANDKGSIKDSFEVGSDLNLKP